MDHSGHLYLLLDLPGKKQGECPGGFGVFAEALEDGKPGDREVFVLAKPSAIPSSFSTFLIAFFSSSDRCRSLSARLAAFHGFLMTCFWVFPIRLGNVLVFRAECSSDSLSSSPCSFRNALIPLSRSMRASSIVSYSLLQGKILRRHGESSTPASYIAHNCYLSPVG